jgi:hypothetical protein
MTIVSDQALLQRIRRALRKDGERLCIARDQHRDDSLGIHVLNANNVVIAYRCTLKGLATEMGLLKPGEEVQA